MRVGRLCLSTIAVGLALAVSTAAPSARAQQVQPVQQTPTNPRDDNAPQTPPGQKTGGVRVTNDGDAQPKRAQPANGQGGQGGGAQGAPGGGGDDDTGAPPVPQRGEPTAAPPANPLEMSDTVRSRIGPDVEPENKASARWRALPPLWIDHRRGDDHQSLYAMLFYQRRSLKMDMDVLFPALWRVRDRDNHVVVIGPIAHREAPNEHDNWLAPLFFEGTRKNAAYFHSPLLLTTSHWNADGAFTLVGPFFRDRTGTDVDLGIAPIFFHGDNGNVDGASRTYTLIPPLLFYHRYHEIDDSSMTVVGPVISNTDTKRAAFDIAPLFFHIEGKPETGGVRESHTTLFPLFHYGYSPSGSLFVIPPYLRRVTTTSDTMLTPFVSHATTRNGGTNFWAVGPVLPIIYDMRDKDIGLHAWAVAPLYYQSSSPRGFDFLTPLVGRFETYGESRSWWFFPTLTVSKDLHGWENDLHPVFYLGRSDQSSHTVIAPVFWDFANPKGRTTVGFPVYWRVADTSDNSVIQVAGNTLYMQKKAVGGVDWQFHLLPFVSYGESPTGAWWNFLFGLVGYDHEGSYTRIKAFWIPIQVAGPSATQTAKR